ncbi:MAG: helix-turn-helix domain-containing protein [Fournierella sp.]|uniref:AraC family transcriptional regulator n=1 Tax=Allofournierella sp. TaxID=1940256 RepID=UPI002A7EC72D|nr:helix-turn-helix domain-containing protein [Fournierella sp.]MDY4167112.1 helix-turn-helix domain-containing protein [Fournierella sp.]
MDERLLRQLKEITEEERAILAGQQGIQRERYTSGRDFVVDSEKMLEKGKLIEIRPHTRFVHFPRHRHNYVEVLYMCSGSTTHILNGTQRMELHTGDLLFLNQAVYHEILPAAEGDVGVNFIILPQFFDRSFRMLEQENVLRDFLVSTLSETSTFAGWLHIAAGDILPVENLLENMIWTLLEKKPGANLLNQTTMGLLLQNLTLFAENINRTLPESRDENAIFSTLQYIETSYRDGTLEEIAARLHMPDYALSRLLKHHTGANFKQLLQQRKLQQAAYLLSNTGMSTDAVMAAVGYENSSYFYRKFREKYACSPAQFRDRPPQA